MVQSRDIKSSIIFACDKPGEICFSQRESFSYNQQNLFISHQKLVISIFLYVELYFSLKSIPDLERNSKKASNIFPKAASGQIKIRLTRKSQLKADKIKVAQKYSHSLSDESRMLLILLMSLVLQGSSGSGGDCTPPSGATLSIM
jgi:hypothetical protein